MSLATRYSDVVKLHEARQALATPDGLYTTIPAREIVMPVQRITLSRGRVALVDEQDYPILSQYHWLAVIHRTSHGERWYAVRNLPRDSDGKRQQVYMHRQLMPLAKEVDHRNNDGLDNQRHNLRECEPWQNNANQRKTRGSSRFKGVSFDGRPGRGWRACITFAGRQRFLGYHDSEVAAAAAYDDAARSLFGEFAKTNEGMG